MNIKGTVIAGSTSAAPISCRLSIVRATSSLTAGRIDNVTINPLANTNILQIYYDKFFTVPSTQANTGFPVNLNLSISVKMKSHIKYVDAGPSTPVGESIFMIWSSPNIAGTTAALFGSGIYEFFFTP